MRRLASLALALSCASGTATPQTWTLDNAVFSDGGTAQGYFSYDPTSRQFTDWQIGVSGGDESAFAPVIYSPSSPGYFSGIGTIVPSNILYFGQFGPGTRWLQFNLDYLQYSGTNLPFDALENYPKSPPNIFYSRSLSGTFDIALAVPEPLEYELLLIGLMALAFKTQTQRRRHWLN